MTTDRQSPALRTSISSELVEKWRKLDKPHTATALANQFNAPIGTVSSLLSNLKRAGYAAISEGSHPREYEIQIPESIPSEQAVRDAYRAREANKATTRPPQTVPDALAPVDGIVLLVEVRENETLTVTYEEARAIWQRLNAIFEGS